MSWYKETMEKKMKENQYGPEASKMPCAKFFKQIEQPKTCNKCQAAKKAQQLRNKEEILDELV